MDPKQELKKIAPNLAQLDQTKGYRVPHDYFANLSDKLMDRVYEEERLQPYFANLSDQVLDKINKEKATNIVSIRSFFRYAIAAVFLLTMGSLLWMNTANDFDQPIYASIEETDDLDFILDNVSLEEILSSEQIEDDVFEEIFASEDIYIYSEESLGNLFYETNDDDLLEEFF